jgi:hypothetical protein
MSNWSATAMARRLWQEGLAPCRRHPRGDGRSLRSKQNTFYGAVPQKLAGPPGRPRGASASGVAFASRWVFLPGSWPPCGTCDGWTDRWCLKLPTDGLSREVATESPGTAGAASTEHATLSRDAPARTDHEITGFCLRWAVEATVPWRLPRPSRQFHGGASSSALAKLTHYGLIGSVSVRPFRESADDSSGRAGASPDHATSS